VAIPGATLAGTPVETRVVILGVIPEATLAGTRVAILAAGHKFQAECGEYKRKFCPVAASE
jgi:hypothetical protein